MEQQEWTIMVYLAGDNNLSVDMAYAMEQIKEVAGAETENVNLFVYYDGFAATIPTLYCDFSDSEKPRQVRSFKVTDKLYPVEENPNENAADYRSIANFVDWCVNRAEHIKDGQVVRGRRADRYALIFSGHSMGFQDIGLFKDENTGKSMSMNQLHAVLERLTKSEDKLIAEGGDQNPDLSDSARTKPVIGQKLDILGFDSCVMGMLEVGNQFDSVAETMIASEGSVPSAGWTYAKILGNLAHHSKSLPVEEIAANFVSEFVRSQDSYTIGGVSVDMAAWDFSHLPQLNAAFEDLADALLECFSDKESTIYKQMARVLLQVHWKCQTYMYDQNVDLGDMCELLLEECSSLQREVGESINPQITSLEAACHKVLLELQNTVILSGFSGGGYQYSNGISLFWPWSLAGYSVSKENYEGLDFVKGTAGGRKWNEFLYK
ncbi:MAG: clostripain-related cysteine peptidase, partial [Acidobacteriota bacterium]|nr:clostripain-related cysteine peptidase [Acidobacteriota bacterium]